jgi:hypothetical protein
VKHKRDSWQTWENYAQVAVRVGQWQTAVRALQQVLALSAGQRLDLLVVAALVEQVESARGANADSMGGGSSPEAEQQAGSDAALAAEGATPAAATEGGGGLADLAAALGELSTSGSADQDGATDEAMARAEARAQQVLGQAVGALLKQVAATVSGDSAFWELYARWAGAVPAAACAGACCLPGGR